MCSTSGRPVSPATTIAQLIWPDSIRPAATVREFAKPRQALEMSKTCVLAGRPIRRWANEAVAGSSMSRDTAAWTNNSTRSAGRAERARSAFPAAALAAEGGIPAGHTRRSRIPVINSSRPKGSLSRS